jgi:hypothetical protein
MWTSFWKIVALAFAVGAVVHAEETSLAHRVDREAPVVRENAVRIHGGALLVTKDERLRFGPAVGVEILRHSPGATFAVGLEVSALQAGGPGGLFDGLFERFAGPGWTQRETSAVLVLPTLTLRPRDGVLRPYLAVGVGPALFRQQATEVGTGAVRQADAFRLAAMARVGVDVSAFDRLSVLVEPVQAGWVAGEGVYGSRLSLGFNF